LYFSHGGTVAAGRFLAGITRPCVVTGRLSCQNKRKSYREPNFACKNARLKRNIPRVYPNVFKQYRGAFKQCLNAFKQYHPARGKKHGDFKQKRPAPRQKRASFGKKQARKSVTRGTIRMSHSQLTTPLHTERISIFHTEAQRHRV